MTIFSVLLYSLVLIVSAAALIIMNKIQPGATVPYLVWVYLIDLLLFLFLSFHSSNIVL